MKTVFDADELVIFVVLVVLVILVVNGVHSMLIALPFPHQYVY